MTKLKEGTIEITLPSGVQGRKFDDHRAHGLSHCMKSVDFVVDLPEHRLFLEIKDPEDPAATQENSKTFVETFLAGKLDYDLKYKYRDSFLYELASGNDTKPIHFYVIVAISRLSAADLLHRTDELRRVLPVQGPSSGVWQRQIVESCMVFNIETWNYYKPRFPLARVGVH